jgi:hypothetical protein
MNHYERRHPPNQSTTYAVFTNRMAAEFMQYRSLSGGAVIEDVAKMSIALAAGDSRTFHPKLMSRISTMFSLAIGCQKLGQPVIQLWSLS